MYKQQCFYGVKYKTRASCLVQYSDRQYVHTTSLISEYFLVKPTMTSYSAVLTFILAVSFV